MNLKLKTTEVFQRNLESNKRVKLNIGGSRCFAPSQLVRTTEWYKPISEIKEGDECLTYNEAGGFIEFKPVQQVHEMDNEKPALEVTLKDGTIIRATEDHKFYFKGGWESLRNIVSLWHDRDLEEDSRV